MTIVTIILITTVIIMITIMLTILIIISLIIVTNPILTISDSNNSRNNKTKLSSNPENSNQSHYNISNDKNNLI